MARWHVQFRVSCKLSLVFSFAGVEKSDLSSPTGLISHILAPVTKVCQHSASSQMILLSIVPWADENCRTRIACKVRLHIRQIVLKYETFTLTTFVKKCDILNKAVRNEFDIHSYMESTFMYNLGLTMTMSQWVRQHLAVHKRSR